ncbi:MAG: polysaccharide deacetylase family protein [Verrucomicrobiae bacterium]|nr:polysaccharide deacetylase family protein [Verrucomicrobiae bacterium]
MRTPGILGLVVPALLAPLAALHAGEPSGVVVGLVDYGDPATVSARLVAPFKLQLAVDPKGETQPLRIRVELPVSGPRAWPAADVEVRDAQGKALTVRRPGIEWHKLSFPVSAVAANYFVQAVPPPGGKLALPSERERALVDSATGVRVGIAKWHDGRKAALSIRFDDSHPTHLTKAIPILREYGFRGTFMVNPGPSEPGSRRRSEFEARWAEWEAVAQRGDQELANHTAHHRGAVGDDDMEAEIGGAAQAIWKLTPGRSKLMALNLGGGTFWETTRTLRYYLDKYYLFETSGSLGMDDTYGNRVAAFRRALEQHIERGLWCRIHYHGIGDGLGSSEANFRTALDVAKEHQSRLWIAGMADIHKYQTERNASKLALQQTGPKRLAFQLICLTDATLYDQPLTIEALLPPAFDAARLVVKDDRGKVIPTRRVQQDGAAILRFDVAPRNAVYAIELTP